MSISLNNKDKLALISNLATMLSAGIPLLEAVEALLDDSKGNLRRVLLLLKTSLSDGKPISYAFAQVPNVFDPIVVNLIKAAEESGTLEETLKDLTKNIKKQMAFTERLRSGLTYPVFVLGVFGLVLLVVLTFVVPRIAKVFEGLRVSLPPATRILIQVSDFMLAFWPYIIVGVIIFIALMVMWYKTQKRVFFNALLKLPLLSTLGRQIDLARFTHSLGLMLKAGIPVIEALELSEQTVVKQSIRSVLRSARENVLAGKSIAEGLREGNRTIPMIMIRTIETGEASGTLETAMMELSDYFEEQVDHTLKTVTTLLEPLLLVVMGILVGGMMLAVIAPIYGLISQINGR